MYIYTATFLNQNYGSFLQAYALQHAINENGGCSVIIQQNSSSEVHVSFVRRIIRFLKPKKNYSYYRRILLSIQGKKFSDKYKKLDAFKKEQLTVEYYSDLQELSIKLDKDDVLLAGSDQIWSMALGPLSRWFTFQCDELPKNIHKYSYAASIGLSELSDEQKQEYKKALKDFSVVSFRERQAKEMLSSFIDSEVRCDLDPTLLYDDSFWSDVSSARIIKEPYVFVYMLRPDKRLIDIGRAIGKKLNCKVIYTGLIADRFNGVYTVCDAGVEDFISYIKYSEGVVTNSFHGTVFSILFKKPFVSVKLSSTSSRVDNLLNIVGLQNQCIGRTEDYESFFNHIDYYTALENLQRERIKSLQYIRHICGGGK